MRRVDRLAIFVEVTHEGGDAKADELLGVAIARLQRAMRAEAAEPCGGSGSWETIRREDDGPASG